RVASARRTVTRAVSPSAAALAAIARQAPAASSRQVSRAAPRDSASRPSAPLPAKASSTRASRIEEVPPPPKSACASTLNSASRARSAVGRTSCPGGTRIARPLCRPPTIRIAALRPRPAPPRLGRRARAELLAQHLAGYFLDRAGPQVTELERPEGQPDQPVHRPAEMLADPPDLAVLAFGEAE